MIEITLQNLTKRYSGTAANAVDNVSLSIAAGEFFFLLGPSGCGKSTLLRMIAGLIEPTAGLVKFGERDVTNLPIEHRGAAMVFQNYALWPHLTVQDNVEFGPKMQGKGRAQRREIAERQLARVEMQGLASRKPNQLSGGQQQRVALARALAAQSNALLLDEPLSNLDARLRLQMRSELRRLVKDTGVTAVYVTHDQAEALSMADRIAVMNGGRVAQIGTPRDLYDNPASRFVADFLGEANFLDARTAGRVPNRDGQPLRLETPAGTLASSRETPPAKGSKLVCCVRPERITVKPRQTAAPVAGPGPGAASAGSIAATTGTPPEGLEAIILNTTYLGHIHQHTCRLTDGTTWRATGLGPATLPDGVPVTLTVDPADVILLGE